jgi:ABC-2 type transport system ATP-binding protein
MMLVADNVSKFFGARQALDSVTFGVGKGEIVGFLGANGAGKSTTMRILTGFVAPTHGSARVGGGDPRRAAVRQGMGYLPEDNPLPARVRVNEYLRFRASLKGLRGTAAAAAIADKAGACGITDSLPRMMGQLSKGTRQRVGLAEALLGDPEVLILDEPTAGLDPRQAAETRELIDRLGGGATVLLSSHILSDIERLCKRVIILEQGRIVADDTLEAIYARHVEERTVHLEVAAREPVREAFRAVPGVRAVAVLQDGLEPDRIGVRITVRVGEDLRGELAALCVRRGWLVTEMRLEPVRLEDIFRRLTGTRQSGRMKL